MLFSRHTKRREFITLLGGATLVPVMACAQRAERVRRIGWLTAQRDAHLAFKPESHVPSWPNSKRRIERATGRAGGSWS
jgi:hypothetical protein